MRRWVLGGVIAALAASVSGCGRGLSEVQTNSGGLLDCPSDTVLYFNVTPTVAGGSSTADGALTTLVGNPLPPGTPQLESARPGEVVYVYTDSEGHRLGRVILRQPHDADWSVLQTERCG